MVRKAGAIALAAMLAAVMLATDGPSNSDVQRRRQSRAPALKIGDKAPDVKLEFLSNGKIYDLKKNFGKRPTVLIFGSYT